MTRQLNFWAVIPAAGIGRRVGAEKPKQYLRILDQTILEHSLRPFCDHPLIKGIAVVVAGNDSHWPTLAISGHDKIIRATGGKERCHSVLNGLDRISDLADSNDWVLVHDAARPCVTVEDIDRLIHKVKDHPAGGILAVPVRDTMKRAGQCHEIDETVSRDNLWRALTPQMFRLGLLKRCIAAAVAENQVVTDESQAMEKNGYKPELVPAGSHNIKISQVEDMALAEFYLNKQRGNDENRPRL